MLNTESTIPPYKDIESMISTMRNLIEETAQIYNKYNNEPTPESIARQQQNSFPNSALIEDVYSRGILSMESAADHLMAFSDSIKSPAKTIAPLTCVRGLMESSALAIWLLDPTIDAHTRAKRSFAFRYTGFIEQIKFLQVDNAQTEISKVEKRMEKVEQDAILLGYPRLLNKGKINGIATHMPSIIDLIRKTLNFEGEYRLLSGVAHGHHWATHQVGFKSIDMENSKGEKVKVLEKHLHPEIVLFATNISITSFAKVLWYLWRLYGWDVREIENFLDKIYDQMRYKPELRFWH